MIENREKEIVIIKGDLCQYPEKETIFSPSTRYPEYPFEDEIALNSNNEVYEMVRNGFICLGLDKANIGTEKWNPLGDVIKPGDYVLLKPNMVLDENHIKQNGTDCLITNSSIIRAVIDYVVIALGNTGNIVVGDAPLQSCNFEKLVAEQGYDLIVDFYKAHGINVELMDFRLIKSENNHGLVELKEHKTEEGCTVVNIEKLSKHGMNEDSTLRVTSYSPDEMAKHHNGSKHEYLVATPILEADVIINLPKPKTHRKAGITGALKNLIGINGNKDWLPHHKKGAANNGGDEYCNVNFFKKLESDVQDFMNRRIEKNRNIVLLQMLKVIKYIFHSCGSITARDQYYEGSWYGNDTIWRTIADLNRILLYCDKEGKLQKEKQRKIFIIGDMIISGEGEGPLMPSPIKEGLLIFGFNAVVFDTIIADIMGFDYLKIPSIYQQYKDVEYPLIDFTKDEVVIKTNKGDISNFKLKTFRPSSGWKNHIEK